MEIEESLPPRPLTLGSTGNDVKSIQVRLNRISTNYPAIPKIPNPNGVFDGATENAVREFQRI
jgi:peptidoglycan hydrolase-like protein with peptidoglycan-binding domain